MDFVKHALALAMLASLAGCGGGGSSSPTATEQPVDPEPESPIITSVSPQNAVIGTLTTFTLSGQNISSDLRANLPNCQGITPLSGRPTSVTFTCTPQVAGTQALTVQTSAGVTLAFSQNINISATPPADAVTISSIEFEPILTVGVRTTFVINGQNLSDAVQVGFDQCQNLTPIRRSSTQITYTCTPTVAGAQAFGVVSAAGVLLSSRSVSIRSAPPTLTGSWRQAAANGCTGSIEGEAIVGVQSRKPLFTLLKDPDIETRVQFIGNQGISYSTADCSEVVAGAAASAPPPFSPTTGIPKPAAIYDNVGSVQLTGDLYYYPVETSYTDNSSITPPATAIVFKNSDTFCLFTGVVTPSNISQFGQSVDLTGTGCFARSSQQPFSQIAPTNFLTTSQYQLLARPQNDSALALLQRLNQQGKQGYILLREAQPLRPTLNSTTTQTYDLMTQIDALASQEFEYLTQNEPTMDANFEQNRLKALNNRGLESRLFIGQKQLDPRFGNKATYVKTQFIQTFAYQLRSDRDVNDPTQMLSILNTQGAAGCRFVDHRLQTTATNTQSTVCVRSNQDSNAYSYRALSYPTSTRADALKALLDTQKSEGFYPIRVMPGSATASPYLLFESDGNNTTGSLTTSMQYKVYSQPLPTQASELQRLLNEQGQLGWHFWSQINDPAGQPLATIFANIPFLQLENGEPVRLDPQ